MPFTKSCVIIAPFHLDVSSVCALLAELQVEGHVLSRSVQRQGSVKARLRSADMVIAVQSEDGGEGAFELGIAFGLGKPCLVLVPPDRELPAALAQMLHVRTGLDDTFALKVAIGRFVKGVDGKVHQTNPSLKPRRQPANLSTPSSPSSIDAIGSRRTSEQLLEGAVRQMLSAAGANVVEAASGWKSKGADLAFWDDALDSTIGNPVLVEVVAGRLSGRRLDLAEESLRGALAKSDARAALLLYSDSHGARFPKAVQNGPLVFRFAFSEFADRLRASTLAHVLLSERNRSLHGRE